MNLRLMNFHLRYQQPDETIIFHTTFWTHSEFANILSSDFESIDVAAMTDHLGRVFQSIKEIFFNLNVFNFLGYSDQCVLTEFVASHHSQIVTIQFSKLYRSEDPSNVPHIVIVDIFVCDQDIDFTSPLQNELAHNGTAKTFNLL